MNFKRKSIYNTLHVAVVAQNFKFSPKANTEFNLDSKYGSQPHKFLQFALSKEAARNAPPENKTFLRN